MLTRGERLNMNVIFYNLVGFYKHLRLNLTSKCFRRLQKGLAQLFKCLKGSKDYLDKKRTSMQTMLEQMRFLTSLQSDRWQCHACTRGRNPDDDDDDDDHV